MYLPVIWVSRFTCSGVIHVSWKTNFRHETQAGIGSHCLVMFIPYETQKQVRVEKKFWSSLLKATLLSACGLLHIR